MESMVSWYHYTSYLQMHLEGQAQLLPVFFVMHQGLDSPMTVLSFVTLCAILEDLLRPNC